MLKISCLSKSFAEKKVTDQISFSVQKGTLTAVLGKSGSGKSTLLAMIAGLIQPDHGDIEINSSSLIHHPPEKRGISMMFQDFALFPHLNVWQNVSFGLKMRGVKETEAKKHAQSILEEVGLKNMENRSINQLSGGEQQRVALARALAVSPEVLLLDEPFSNLDTTLRQHLQQQILELIKLKNIATIMVSHDPNESCAMANQIILLHEGKILQAGTPFELLNKPISAQTIQLLGGINITENHYIPPTAIKINPLGKTSTLLSSIAQPLFVRNEVLHPDFGKLIFFSENVLHQTSIQIAIDEQKIVHFESK